jgi:hypothetical protein
MEPPLYRMLRLSLIVAASLVSSLLHAEPISLRGDWQQVLSNAGGCERCRVSIRQSGSALEVIANNGWTATVIPNQDLSSQTAKGEGRWGPNAGGSYKGQSFQIFLAANRNGRLWMGMSVRGANGRDAFIQAFFERMSFPPAASEL